MKSIKSIILGLLLLTVFGAAYGQEYMFDIGVEGSSGVTFLHGKPPVPDFVKPTAGFSSGLFFQYNLKKVVSLRTNIAIERKGSMHRYEGANSLGDPIGEVRANFNLNYLTVPLLVRATFGKKIHYFINAGPYFGFLISSTFVVRYETAPTERGRSMAFLNRFDTGISAGLGLAAPITKKHAFSFEIRNNLGLYNISNAQSIDNSTRQTNSINFLLGLTYKLGRRTSYLLKYK
jgi:hypothetical protein